MCDQKEKGGQNSCQRKDFSKASLKGHDMSDG
jgi:hypothetical protein